jgi:outer membrane receptor protein involved in Fe transport
LIAAALLPLLPGAGRAQLSGLKDGALVLPGAIEGRLSTAAGVDASLEAVTVTVLKNGAASRVDARGYFAIKGLPPDTYTLVATGEGFSPLFITDVVVRPREQLHLNVQQMPALLREGVVYRMDPVIVNASKQAQAPERLDIFEPRSRPFTTANVDVPRTRDDVQPYYFFDRETIERSGAAMIEDFASRRIPMDTTRLRTRQYLRPSLMGFGAADNQSAVNLNGLGAEQTLILVNGRRLPQVSVGGAQNHRRQPDVNGVPLGAIERIELLPASAAAIYGSGAVGGVMNVVLRDEYDGAELTLGYENPFRGHAPIRRATLIAGKTLGNGRTHVMISLSQVDSLPLVYGDRAGLLTGLRERAWRNDPGASGAPSYDSNPLGTTPNITAAPTSRTVEGKVTSVPGELFGPGSSDHAFVPEGYAGGAGIEAFRSTAGRYNLDPVDTSVGNYAFYGLRYPLELAVKVSSGYASVRHRFRPGLEAFTEFFHGENVSQNLSDPGAISVSLAATAPTNPFGVAVRVAAPLPIGGEPGRQVTIEDRLVGGIRIDLPQDWRGEVDYVLGDTSVASRTGRFSGGRLAAEAAAGRVDLLRDLRLYPLSLDDYRGTFRREDAASLQTFDARAAGVLWPMPAGDVSATFGAGIEREEMHENLTESSWASPPGSTTSTRTPAALGRNLHGYAEVEVPLISGRNPMPGVAQLDLQAAGRVDRFVFDGSTGETVKHRAENYVVGLRYRPVAGVMFRASRSSAIQPPEFSDFVPMTPPLLGLSVSPTGWTFVPLRDPRRGGEYTTSATGSLGGNPAVRPSKTRSSNIGIVLEPRFARGLRIALDYVLIERHDEITSLAWQGIVDSEAELPGRVVRAPVESGDPFGVGRITFVDGSSLNIASSRSASYNLAIDYAWLSGKAGRWSFFGIVNSWQHYQRRLRPDSSPIEYLNGDVTSLRQPKYTASAGLNWDGARWFAGWSTRFVGRYRTAPSYVRAQGSEYVASQITHDVYLGYAYERIEGARGWRQRTTSGLSLQVGIKNAFDVAPAFEAGEGGRFHSPYGDLRMRSYYFTLRKRF